MTTFNYDDYTYLANGSNNMCYYKGNVVAKVFRLQAEYKPEKEGEQLKKANKVNSLAVNFLGLEYFDNCTVVYMEKLTPLNREDFTFQVREQMLAVFKDQLRELHSQGIYHIDIKTPFGSFSNVILTAEGLKLIDWGRSYELASYGVKLVHRKEWEDVDAFCKWFLEPEFKGELLDFPFEDSLDIFPDFTLEENSLDCDSFQQPSEESVERLIEKQFQGKEELNLRMRYIYISECSSYSPKDWYFFSNEQKAEYISSLPIAFIKEAVKAEDEFWASIEFDASLNN